jgi:hypothetical protein
MIVCIPGLSTSHEDTRITPEDTRISNPPVSDTRDGIVWSRGVTLLDGEPPQAESEHMRKLRERILRREDMRGRVREVLYVMANILV